MRDKFYTVFYFTSRTFALRTFVAMGMWGYDEACEHEEANNTSCFMPTIWAIVKGVMCRRREQRMLQGSIATFDSKRLLLKTVEIGIDELYPPTTSKRGNYGKFSILRYAHLGYVL